MARVLPSNPSRAGSRPDWRALSLVVAVCPLCACDRSGTSPDSTPSANNARTAPIYQSINGSEPVARVDAQAQVNLDTAIAAARSTMDEARQRWEASGEIPRRRWLIKWAAPLNAEASGGPEAEQGANDVEHVWVLPMHWSAFRIEGILVSRPVRDLDCGKHEGDLVGFPVEELSDWVFEPAPGSPDANAGGYTIKALESRTPR